MNTTAGKLNKINSGSSYKDFKDFLKNRAEKFADKAAFIIKEKNEAKNISYKHISYNELSRDVKALGTALLKQGWQNKKIGIIGINCYEWMLIYLAALCIGASVVPLDKSLPYEELCMSLKRSGSDIIFHGKDYEQYISDLRSNDGLDIISVPFYKNADGQTLYSLIEKGRVELLKGDSSFENAETDPHRASIILFTSGTTSMAKAVLLSQQNILSNLYDMSLCEDIRSSDVNIAFLPYHHTFGCTGQLVMLNAGASSCFCDGLKYVQKNLEEYQVSLFVCVPLLIEAIYKRIIATAKKTGLEKKLQTGIKLSRFLMKLHIDARRLIFKSVLKPLGGKLRLIISGASALNPEAQLGLQSFGIETIQGYGMTESAPVLCAENRDFQKPGSIGKAMPSVDLIIKDPNEEGIGELLAKGPNVMLGYLDDEAASAEALKDGWLHTGDLAHIDDDGFVFLCGRKKNVIVLKNGKNVYPEEIEDVLANLPYALEVMVFAMPKSKSRDDSDLALYTKMVYNAEYMKENFDAEDPEEIHQIILKDIEVINEKLPAYKRIFRLITSKEGMVKTTTAKVKRFEEIQRIRAELADTQ